MRRLCSRWQDSRTSRRCKVVSVHGRRGAIRWKQGSACPFSDSHPSHAPVMTYRFRPERTS